MLIKDLHEEYVHDTKMVSYWMDGARITSLSEYHVFVLRMGFFAYSNWKRDSKVV